ncbi:MAG: preprotein translocase subunit YajC [Schwartzia sp. (in: firmicutes)]
MEDIQTFFAAYSPIIMLVVMYGAFHFFLIRPQNAEKARREDMLKNLHKGNKVMTVGGIYGEILEIKDNIIDLKIAEQVVIQVARASISVNLSQGKSVKEEPAAKSSPEPK